MSHVCPCGITPATNNGISNMAKAKRAALYLRVSTDGQSVENQRLALQAVAAQRGWSVVAGYDDNGIGPRQGTGPRREAGTAEGQRQGGDCHPGQPRGWHRYPEDR